MSQDIINFEDREICNEVKIDVLALSKLHSFWPVIVDQSLITLPKVDVVATMSPTALVAIITIADLCA